MTDLASVLKGMLQRGEPAALVTVAEARGSTPREPGARMLVGADATVGTIGGGRLEWDAISRARMLASDPAQPTEATIEVPLGPAIGQCCGGHVTLRLERADPAVLTRIEAEEQAASSRLTRVLLFGAGHVGKAIATALAPLPFDIQWIDERPEEFPTRPPGDNVHPIVTSAPLDLIAEAPTGSCYLILTHLHALDFQIAEAVLRRADFAYAGLIGSATKRRRFERTFTAHGGDPQILSRLTCPIGSALHRDKRPTVIAALVAAELLITVAIASKEAEEPADARLEVKL
ncbi:xanthine dehydrogenase accessory protein XdhC [Skermanella aerolata]|uniref:Xanthine dehydrogenase accessory protein XdhC n=1 Tax=Skermanella aerolata TaxID=393310 RepID=A0A512DXJ8_9PROT|nr:xanthine dehydrogenase accessory protein XdhC [Skermanella aerolata]KJB92216.1 xanthine dehydrogenase [Skermanella aerolata KACC 11604]GEO41191.1 xanthine dehydrogenase accessory protein XdhC [Skermanella aerolata]